MPGSLGDLWERRRAKHQALRATQMLHLCSCKRFAGREKVEAQAEDDIRILCQWRGPRGCNISQLAERKRNRLRPFTGHLEDQISAPPKAMQVSQHCVSWEPGESGLARRTLHREPNLHHKTKLWNLQMV